MKFTPVCIDGILCGKCNGRSNNNLKSDFDYLKTSTTSTTKNSSNIISNSSMVNSNYNNILGPINHKSDNAKCPWDNKEKGAYEGQKLVEGAK